MILERSKRADFKGISTLKMRGHPWPPTLLTPVTRQQSYLFFTLLYKKGENKTSTVGLKLRQTPLSHSLPPPMIQIQVVVVVETYKNTP